jgi:hypothetical protein
VLLQEINKVPSVTLLHNVTSTLFGGLLSPPYSLVVVAEVNKKAKHPSEGKKTFKPLEKSNWIKQYLTRLLEPVNNQC